MLLLSIKLILIDHTTPSQLCIQSIKLLFSRKDITKHLWS